MMTRNKKQALDAIQNQNDDSRVESLSHGKLKANNEFNKPMINNEAISTNTMTNDASTSRKEKVVAKQIQCLPGTNSNDMNSKKVQLSQSTRKRGKNHETKKTMTNDEAITTATNASASRKRTAVAEHIQCLSGTCSDDMNSKTEESELRRSTRKRKRNDEAKHPMPKENSIKNRVNHASTTKHIENLPQKSANNESKKMNMNVKVVLQHIPKEILDHYNLGSCPAQNQKEADNEITITANMMIKKAVEEPRRSKRKRGREMNNELYKPIASAKPKNDNKKKKRKSTARLRLREKIETASPVNEYVPNEVVLATIPGFAPWPARILNINEQTIFVEFFGTGQINPVRSSAISRFEVTKVIPLLARKGYTKAIRELEMVLMVPSNSTLFQ